MTHELYITFMKSILSTFMILESIVLASVKHDLSCVKELGQTNSRQITGYPSGEHPGFGLTANLACLDVAAWLHILTAQYNNLASPNAR